MNNHPAYTGIPIKKRLLRLAALVLCLAVMLLPLLPGSGEPAEERKVVRVGWYESSFNATDRLGRKSGYAYEYQMKIAAYTGWEYEYVVGSWSELLEMLIDGEIDLMSDVSYKPERAKLMLFPSLSLPMGAEEYYLFVDQGNTEITSSDYSTLNGKRIGVNKGSFQAGLFRDWVEEHGISCEIVELSNTEMDSLSMLKHQELDGYVTVDSFSVGAIQESGRPVPVCKIGSSDFYFAVTNSRPDLLNELESAMVRIQEEDRYYSQKLVDKHLETAGANAFLTADEKEWLENHGPIRVGYQDNYLAFCAKDPDTGELTGALKDYLEIAASCMMNARLEFETKAYDTAADAMDALKRGEVDCIFPANLSPGDGEDLGLFMTPSLMKTDLFAVMRQGETHGLSGRDRIVVAVNRGNPNYDSTLDDLFPSWQRVVYDNTDECLKAVSKGVADCVLISSYRYNNIARQCDRLNLTTVATGEELEYCFAVAAGNPKLYSVMAKVAELVPQSTVTSALNRYITKDAQTSLEDFLEDHLWLIIGITAAIFLVILLLMLRNMRAHRQAARLIAATETDTLTGLYNRDYFLEYAGRMNREHPDTPMDAIVLNIDRFHALNAMNGREFGDRVLQTLGDEIKSAAAETGGIAGRFEADRFDLYCRGGEDYKALYNRFQDKLEEIAPGAGIRLRMGVMPWQQGLAVVQMFDRARTACGMARDNYKEHMVVYDRKMQEREAYEHRLLSDLHRALNSYEFEVYYQPQYDIQCDPPRVVSAEALVRWNHPKLGMIPPGDFIPLLERNGKIGEVDRYVWNEAARQVARWRDAFGVNVPVSVNLSRLDVFDPSLENALEKLLAYNGLTQDNLKLEVTESAYTNNAEQVVRVVESLRMKGYMVEMDDFGTGYSSLNMLSAMPVDVLKMDRDFIRRLGKNERDDHMVALILEIARGLKIPVVAEGVETEEQLHMLKVMGCQLVQGFYFSKPLPAAEFEDRIISRMSGAGKEDA